MSVERLRSLRRQYLSLGVGELCAATVFVLVGAATVAPKLDADADGAALWFALVPLVVVLIEGGSYWLLARRWIGRHRMPSQVADVFRFLRVVDVGLLAAGLLGVVIFLPSGPVSVGVVVVIWLFGVAEFLNYFVVRLAYPPTRWVREVTKWRTPRLVRDLSRRGRTGRHCRRAR